MPSLPALNRPAQKAPLPNSYWVVPGRLLAGEHPGGGSLATTTQRLHALLSAGVTLFIDLTEEGEVADYSHLLIYASGAEPINYVRHAIGDHGVPDSPQVMQNILEAIDVHLSQQGVVYVHCRAGIGRTGTAIGCYLVRLGLHGEAGLDRLNELWCESERSKAWPSVPETEAQIDYVRKWQSTDPKITTQQAQTSAKVDRFMGAVLGMAIGEALGATVALDPLATASMPGAAGFVRELASGGPHNVPRGAWLSNTAMSWALAESYLACNRGLPEDQMERYLEWQRDGKYSSTGVPLDVPADVRKALAQWQWTRKPIAGSHDPENRDAHALARTLAVALYYEESPARALLEAAEAARTTIQAPVTLDANRVYVTLLLDALSGVEKDALLSLKQSDNAQQLRRNKLKPPVMQTIDGWWRGPAAPARTGRDVLAVLSTALWAFDRTDDFREGLVLAANLCGNPTCAGAVFGALAGAFYGMQRIPQEWRSALLQTQPLNDLANRLANR
jgi:ADP-ribosylglycohydrolase